MYIPNKEWDELNANAIEIVEAMEKPSFSLRDLSPYIQAILYDIIHMQDKPLPIIINEKWYKKLLRKACCKKRE